MTTGATEKSLHSRGPYNRGYTVQLTTTGTYSSGQTRHHTCYMLQLWDTNQLMHPNQCCMDNALVW